MGLIPDVLPKEVKQKLDSTDEKLSRIVELLEELVKIERDRDAKDMV